MVVFTGMPIPVSLNAQYATIIRGRRSIRVKSREAVVAAKEFEKWAILNVRSIIEAKNTIALWESQFVEVSMFLCLKHDRLVCKDGSPKKIDVSNYLKSAHDLLAEKIGVDDSCFVSVPTEKCIADPVEEVIMVIRPKAIRSAIEVKAALFCTPRDAAIVYKDDTPIER